MNHHPHALRALNSTRSIRFSSDSCVLHQLVSLQNSRIDDPAFGYSVCCRFSRRSSKKETKPKEEALIIFVNGGITHAEIQAVYELMSKHRVTLHMTVCISSFVDFKLSLVFWMTVKSYKCLEPPYVLCTLWSRLNKLAGCPILSCINQQYCIMFISRTQMPPASPWQFVQLVLLADQYLYRRHTLSNFNQFCGRRSWALARARRPTLVPH